MPNLSVDEDDRLQEHTAVVYAPKKMGRGRQRFPANIVEPVASVAAGDALLKEKGHEGYRLAVVCGPSKSSEGLMLYYLVRWL